MKRASFVAALAAVSWFVTGNAFAYTDEEN
jgi:hypothetical protein